MRTDAKLWCYRSKHFNAEMKCWWEVEENNGPPTSKLHWNVYAYVFPSHPRFEELKTGHIDALNTTYRRVTDECVELGSDYAHEWDREMEDYADAYAVRCEYRNVISELSNLTYGEDDGTGDTFV